MKRLYKSEPQKEICQERERLRRQENLLWPTNSNGNPEQMPRFEHDELGLNFVSPAPIPTALSPLLTDLSNLKEKDKSLSYISKDTFHFTFLALSFPQWRTQNDVPEALLKAIPQEEANRFLRPWTLKNLRLIPTKNNLLLAGIPSEQTLKNRQHLTSLLLKTKMGPYIRERHTGLSLPPLLYHSTLVRYERAFLSQNLQGLYQDYKEVDFGELPLERPFLYLSNNNFSKKERLC